jgi:hypothetical protein
VSLNEDIKSKEGRKLKQGYLGTKDNPVCAKAAPPTACTAGVRNKWFGHHQLRRVGIVSVLMNFPEHLYYH